MPLCSVIYARLYSTGEPNRNFNSKGRQAILSKLDQIRFDEVRFDGLPLSEVVKTLGIEAKKRDSEKKGINFIIKGPSTGSTIDSITGQLVDPDRINMNSIAIKIHPALADVKLADVLDAIVMVADKPIKYSIEDYAVVFSEKTAEAAPLYTRTFKLDPNTFYKSIERVSANSFEHIPTNHSTRGSGLNFVTRQSQVEIVQATVRAYFLAAGVELNPPKNIFYSDGQGRLMVRGTLQDLDIVESIVQTLNTAPPQIAIEAKFIEVTEQVAKELWRNLTLTNNVGTNAWTSILTESQTKTLLKQLELKSGVDVLTLPRVTTLSGRQAQIQTPPGTTFTDGTSNSLYLTETLPFGPILNVIPTVSADAYEIAMTVIPTVTEFLGYDENRSGRVPVYIKGKRKWELRPPPKFRTRQIVASAFVWDGQTLMLRNPLDANNQIAEKPGDSKKRLIVLVTPTLIDPAGNRVHKEDEIPPAKRK